MRYRTYGDNLTPIWALIIVNLLIFIAAMVNGEFIVRLFGLLKTDSFVESLLIRPWTIVTSMFTHVDIWHILANMVTLYFFGRLLSRLIGAKYLLITYFLGGILGSVFFLLLAQPYSIAIGASGAVFALGGTLTILTPKLRVLVFPIPVPLPLWVAIIGGFVILSFIPGIAWQAHLGGLVFGLLVGYYFRKTLRILFY